MNPSKKDNSGWILCPSKSFPGKFYYFNVLNGETAWSLNDADQKAMRKDNILQKADKSHSYPEPTSPPGESPTTKFGLNMQKTVPNIIRRINNIPPTTPMFGQATFPTYISNVEPYMQNIIWAPIQLPVFPKPWQDQAPQLSEPERGIFVQTCNIPLSKRFANYEEPKFHSNTNSAQFIGLLSQNNIQPVRSFSNNVLNNSQIFGATVHSENANDSSKKVVRQRTHSESDSITGTFYVNKAFGGNNAQIFNDTGKNNNVDSINQFGRQRTLSESDSIIFEKPVTHDQPKSFVKPSLQIHNLFTQNVECSEKNAQPKSSFVLRKSVLNPSSNIQNTYSQNRSTGPLEKTEKDKKENAESSLWCNQIKQNRNVNKIGSFSGNLEKDDWRENKKSDFLGNLDKNDLRYTLERKRRKDVDLGNLNDVEDVRNYNVPVINTKQKEPIKKRVMFDIDTTDESTDNNQEGDGNSPLLTIDNLRRLADQSNGLWYIVVDTNVLLDDCDFIDKFVRLDKKCKMYVPNAVRTEIEEFCFGDCRGQQRVIAARQLTRKLATPTKNIVVQPAENEDEIFTKMSTVVRILNCCLNILKQNEHVVLVTDDTVLYEKAKSLNIHCFKLNQIKDGVSRPHGKPQRITLKDQTTKNLFLQNESYSSNMNRDTPIESSKKSLFNKDCNAVTNSYVQTNVKNTTDANTSPIKFEEMLVEKKGKSRDYLNFNYDSDSDATASKALENLVIKDKNSNFLRKNSNNERKSNSFTFQIKNKKNIAPQKEQTCSQLQNSKKESAFSEPRQNVQFQNQNQKMADQKEIQTTNKTEQLKKSLGDKLKQRFQVKSKFMEENIRSNIVEWLCTFRQIMEHALSAYLQDNPGGAPRLPPPWSVHEAVTCVRDVFREGWVATVADQLSLLLLNNCTKRGELKRDIKPEEFMRMFGCGVILVELLQAASGDSTVWDSQQLLHAMQGRLEQGAERVELVRTPVLHRGAGELRQNFSKRHSDIVHYLKNHFPSWQNYSEAQVTNKVITQKDNKIVRTFGRNLNLLTIDKSKSMIMKESPDKHSDEDRDTTKLSKNSSDINISDNTLIHSQSTIKLNDDTEPKIIRLFDKSTPFPKKKELNTIENISLTPKHGNTFGDIQETSGPKVIRNLKLIDSFEEKLKSKEPNICYSSSIKTFSLSDVSLCTSVADNDLINHTRSIDHNENDNKSLNDNRGEQNNDIDKPNDSSTNDSGFVNETDTFTLIQTFLSELSTSMKFIYTFIEQSMEEFRKKELQNDAKKFIIDRATITHGHLSGIIYKLNCIIQRESDEVTPLKEIILKADVVVVGDIRLMRYRQVVMKCLEQAQLLEGALKILIAVTEGDYDVTYCSDRQTFLNIFE